MSYLSKIELDLLHRETQKIVSDLYRLHQSIMGGFKEADLSVSSHRVLFRSEPEIRDNRFVSVLVQSPVAPDWNHLHRYGANIETKPFEFVPRQRELYRFRIRANPVVMRNRKRYGLIGEADQKAWLLRKECGVEWHIRTIIDEGYKKGQKNGRTIQYKSVRYEGYLRVLDSSRLLQTVHEGIGPAKGFGFGLLSLAKA